MLGQFGSSLGEWLRISPAKLIYQAPFSLFSLTSMVPGRRTLISEFSMLGKVTSEVKYVTAGWDKGWVDKHKGIVTHCFTFATNAHGNYGNRPQSVWLGRYKQRASLVTLVHGSQV